MEKFEEYFRRADLDKDGRISGAEAVAFFQASNLPKPTLAQIWQHADQNRTGFLGRQEFFNALKLVTVAQSNRELTPDIVKAALYGPASSKIPAPQINLAALPPAQPNAMGPRPPTQQPGIVNSMAPRPPTQQPGVVNSMQTQNFGIRSQGPPNSVAPPSAQYFAPQGNQSMRPPPQSGPLPSQGVGGPSFPAGGGLASSGLSNSNVSGDWLGSRGVGSTVPKPQEPLPSSSFTAPRPSVSGTGIASSPMFGGDLFSASSSSSMPTPTASIPPVSSAIVPATSEPQTPAKIDPLGALNAFTRQPTGAPVQSVGPSAPRPNQQVPTQNAKFGYQDERTQVPNTERTQVPNTSLPQWPKMTRAGVNKYMRVFMEVDSDRDGKITGDQARSLFLSWRLPREILKQVWDLSDQDDDSMLSLREFCIAIYLMERYREGQNLPPTLPSNVLLDETLLSLTGPPNPSYRPAGWGANPGSAPQQPGMPGPQQMLHANMRPPMPGAPPMQYNQPKGPMPSINNSHAHQLSNGDQNTSRSVPLETTEAEKVVEDKKEIMHSREKMAFYRNKMQDLMSSHSSQYMGSVSAHKLTGLYTASPRKSDSPQGNNSFFQKKSPFGVDDSVPGSPASRAGTSPRYSGGGAENSFFDNFSTLSVPLTEVLPNKKPSRDLIP